MPSDPWAHARMARSLDARADAVSHAVATLIDTLAGAAFDLLWRYLVDHPGADARQAINEAQAGFSGGFAQRLAEAFSMLLQRSIGVGEVRALPVGDITLARRLYLHNVTTAAEVTAVVREHAKGLTQARTLARELYDGYNPRDGITRPLEGAVRAKLPKALRELTADPAARESLTAVMTRMQEQAKRLRTEPLKAAYLDAIKAWERGAGTEALKRRLEVAQREKNRFVADRIARTELARAHQAKVGREILDDDLTTVVRVRLSGAHPRVDICDMIAKADLHGLGPGCYPKRLAPVPPFHPFCLCALKPRPSLDAADAQQALFAEQRFLRSLPAADAARVMGSAARAQQVLNGASVESIYNSMRDPAYRMRRLGEMAPHPLVDDKP